MIDQFHYFVDLCPYEANRRIFLPVSEPLGIVLEKKKEIIANRVSTVNEPRLSNLQFTTVLRLNVHLRDG